MTNTAKDLSSPNDRKNVNLRKFRTSLEQEYLLTMMRHRVGLMIDDLVFRFDISNMLASSVFTT